ncbi:hypothetical protein RDWZM_004746 [Blomia tropicalis]|uniref:Secreted protein n=1 Tax=Blomia tropicalis TaxID=40697 RepID=A0A9Q0RLN3_BLOTA|nr:hypothetical protein RDWZM_004746 [Blomia tropicalis]
MIIRLIVMIILINNIVVDASNLTEIENNSLPSPQPQQQQELPGPSSSCDLFDVTDREQMKVAIEGFKCELDRISEANITDQELKDLCIEILRSIIEQCETILRLRPSNVPVQSYLDIVNGCKQLTLLKEQLKEIDSSFDYNHQCINKVMTNIMKENHDMYKKLGLIQYKGRWISKKTLIALILGGTLIYGVQKVYPNINEYFNILKDILSNTTQMPMEEFQQSTVIGNDTLEYESIQNTTIVQIDLWSQYRLTIIFSSIVLVIFIFSIIFYCVRRFATPAVDNPSMVRPIDKRYPTRILADRWRFGQTNNKPIHPHFIEDDSDIGKDSPRPSSKTPNSDKNTNDDSESDTETKKTKNITKSPERKLPKGNKRLVAYTNPFF